MGVRTAIIFLVLILAVVAGGYLFCKTYFPDLVFWQENEREDQVCTLVAKICPDGTSVGHVGPNCEFADCPEETTSWGTYINDQVGFEMKYPDNFFDPSQQPRLFTGDCNYSVFPDSCPDINDIVAQDIAYDGGDITTIESNLSQPGYWDISGLKQEINGTTYCLFATGDSSAGRAFNYYYYSTVKDEGCLVVYLAVTTENCDFYLPFKSGDTGQEENYNNCLKTNAAQPITFKKIISSFSFINQ